MFFSHMNMFTSFSLCYFLIHTLAAFVKATHTEISRRIMEKVKNAYIILLDHRNRNIPLHESGVHRLWSECLNKLHCYCVRLELPNWWIKINSFFALREKWLLSHHQTEETKQSRIAYSFDYDIEKSVQYD